MYLLNLLDVNGYLFCKQKSQPTFFDQKCGLTCLKFQVSHAQRNHCLWMIYVLTVFALFRLIVLISGTVFVAVAPVEFRCIY